MHKFFTPRNLFQDSYAFIEGEDVKHIYKVLRIEEGQKIIINDLQGSEFEGVIEEITKQRVKVRLEAELSLNNESPLKLYLYQGMPKAAKMDLVVQKNTELGVKAIIPVITSRTDVVVKGEYKKLDRLQRIALEASKQSKRTIIPDVREPIDFKSMLEQLKGMDLIAVPYENADNYGVKAMAREIQGKSIENVAVVIGPEGGFEEGEIEELKAMGAHILTLGPRILRTETAGFTIAALLQYVLGDLGGVV